MDWSVLSTDLKICHAILDAEEKESKTWFSKLVRTLEKDASRATISKSIDKLFDLGMIDGNWEKVDGKWTRTFTITGEARDFIKKMYRNTTGHPSH